MRSPEEIKAGLDTCVATYSSSCKHCPYRHGKASCSNALMVDALEYIHWLEKRVKELKQEVHIAANRTEIGNNKLESLGLSKGVTDALYRGGITDVATLTQKSARELRKIRCVGSVSVCAIRTALNGRGLKLAGDT